ncbi:hypothetical protein Pst134EA_024339 [Puccinia striiformis f. sp. tritici]|uniref:Major facilitator superfamily (MFS) profile domain-containing protein n=1 Tax=Puccinia striiformis f. sp. tritici PST-78 TaxID=1165861 RepID=A0A0L0VDF6_9BASI|nr:hypothetical protein Pst134EA_024339 [Puccinia striiformis f. sp. tritici]KAH9453467.1 hypothetical protein Pst134EA_024339 [Puccinia striiformis f. sp. tritici]KNE97325.1 hypothetical protein PSTG_09436 [Puccinia striiformis f. sp. tritici PST-78]
MAHPFHSEATIKGSNPVPDPNDIKSGSEKELAGQFEDGKLSSERLERSALWKLDLTVIPIVAMFYFLSFLDRSNLGNARIAGLQSSLGLTDHQYSIALTVTYIPYIVAEIPANLLLKKLGPNYFLPGIVTCWGLITTLQGFVRSYSGLIAARFFLGLVEGGMFPAIVLYLSFFYTRRELQIRIALFFSAASLSGAFSGLLAYGIIRLDGTGDLPGWSWIFIIEGLFTFFWGVISFFIFPASIEANKYLKPSEKAILKARLARDRPMADDALDRFSFAEVLASLKSPHVLLNVVSLFMSGTVLYSQAYFQPTIVNSLGYSTSRSQLMSVPPFVVAFVVMIVTAYISDKYCTRGLVTIGCSLIGMIGFILFHVAHEDQTSLKYGSLFISLAGVYSTIPPLSAWQSNNSECHYRRASSIALGFIASNLGGILSTWMFPQSEKPGYRTGTLLSLAFCVGMVITVTCNLIWLKSANRSKIINREKILKDYPTHDQLSHPENTRVRQQAWADLGDRHPDFKYTY